MIRVEGASSVRESMRMVAPEDLPSCCSVESYLLYHQGYCTRVLYHTQCGSTTDGSCPVHFQQGGAARLGMGQKREAVRDILP